MRQWHNVAWPVAHDGVQGVCFWGVEEAQGVTVQYGEHKYQTIALSCVYVQRLYQSLCGALLLERGRRGSSCGVLLLKKGRR
jgi:hypothetical protein